ncbi:MAG TPA: DUF3662 and FHA domain-containing protein [Nocardioidaceae bacterium]|nr:DUF3662 and FHA domain-containing protein [Nocardioidaceae bacterium]
MGVLHRFEQRLEHMVTGAFARAFRSAVQPVEIAAALQREIDNSAQVLSRDRLLAPNSFHVELSEPDFERLSPYGDALSAELATLVREHVSEQRYTLAGPLDISFGQGDDLTTGRFRVRSRANAEVTQMAGQPSTGDAPVLLEVNGERHPLQPPGIVVGRGSDAGLRINDPGVSRKHVEIRVDVGGGQVTVSAIDLGSTNGTSMDGRRVQQALLHDGSTIVIGNTTMVVRDPTAMNERSG